MMAARSGTVPIRSGCQWLLWFGQYLGIFPRVWHHARRTNVFSSLPSEVAGLLLLLAVLQTRPDDGCHDIVIGCSAGVGKISPMRSQIGGVPYGAVVLAEFLGNRIRPRVSRRLTAHPRALPIALRSNRADFVDLCHRTRLAWAP